MPDSNCTVSVLAWAPGTDRAAAAAILVEALGLDPYMASLRAAKSPPMVVARVATPIAKSVLGVLRSRGAQALVFSDDDIARLPAPILAKRLEAAPEAPEPMYLVEPWRGERTGLRMSEVYCLVRGRIRLSRIGPAQVDVGPRHMTYGIGGLGSISSVGAAAVGGFSDASDVSVTRDRSSKITDVIDLWLRSPEHPKLPRRIRITGNKFNWDILGPQRAMTANESANKLALLLAGDAPQAAIELGFTEFCDSSTPAIGSGWSATMSGGSRLDQNPAFEFYSAWCALRNWVQRSGPRPAQAQP